MVVNLDSPGSLVLEADAVQPLVHVDGVLPRHHLSHSGSLLLFTRHFASATITVKAPADDI